jgi:dihydrofolate reductase
MRKVVLFIATSLDGYIADTSGGVDWLFTDQDYGYTVFLETIDSVIMGRTTYEQILSFGEYPYSSKTGFVFSETRSGDRDENVEFVSGDVKSFVENLRQSPGKDIWLIGGGKLVRSFVQENLIDMFIIYVHPIILGAGISLFPSPLSTTHLTFQKSQAFDTGLVQLVYERE